MQVEGAFIMGLGYWLTEKLDYDGQSGELTTFNTWVCVHLEVSDQCIVMSAVSDADLQASIIKGHSY